MSSRISIAAVLTLPLGVVMFGTGAAIVLGTPFLSPYAPALLPLVGVAALLVSPVVAYFLAPCLSARHRRQAATKRRLLEERARREIKQPHRHFIRQRVPVAVRAAPRLSSRPVGHWQ